MAKHFGPHNMKNGYAAMGNSMRRPRYKGANHKRTVADAIAAGKRATAMAARIKK